jgi:hypothetical protein
MAILASGRERTGGAPARLINKENSLCLLCRAAKERWEADDREIALTKLA